jgi:CheY-like chemotaxis protein
MFPDIDQLTSLSTNSQTVRKIIRAIHKEPPIIALTAMGMNDYISKPFTVEKLKNTLLE